MIQAGDTIYKLSQKYGVPIDKIISDNNVTNPNNLMIGQTLVILPETKIYTVKKGDTLYNISRSLGVSIDEILASNPSINNPDIIYIGQELIIPGETTNKLGSIDVNGFVFPGTTSQVLTKILPSLTYISVFSYSVSSDGALTNDVFENRILNLARDYDVAPVMVISNTIEGKGFNSDIAHSVLNNPDIQQRLINNIIEILKEKNYYGVNVDFEYVYPYDKEPYNNFLRNLTDRLHQYRFMVSTSLAPKVSDSQPGVLYEAHDYRAQGKIVDQIILMTYEWGYTYGPPQAVSPINQMERVLQYAVSVIPSEKILMGLPNYGYDWSLPFVQGSAAQSLTNTQALNLAVETGSEIRFDELSQTPFFEYQADGVKHVVWFDDARSLNAKLKLVEKYKVLGVSYWNLHTFFAPNWAVLNSLYNINKEI